jgi:hypothetical protein
LKLPINFTPSLHVQEKNLPGRFANVAAVRFPAIATGLIGTSSKSGMDS